MHTTLCRCTPAPSASLIVALHQMCAQLDQVALQKALNKEHLQARNNDLSTVHTT